MHPILSFAAVLSGAGIAVCATKPPITAVAFAPDGKTVLVASQAGIEERSWPKLQFKRNVKTDLEHVHALAFSPRGNVLAAAGGSPSESGIVELFEWPKAEKPRQFKAHADLIYGVAWKPDGGALATASADGTCTVLDSKSGKQLTQFKGHSRPVLSLCYLPDQKTIVSTGIDQSLRVWSADDGSSIRALDNHVKPVHALALRPSTDADALPMLASVSDDKTVRLWQPTIGRMVRFKRLDSAALDVTWSADGTELITVCRDGHVRVIDPDSLQIRLDRKALDGWGYVARAARKGKDVIVGGEGGVVRRISRR